MKMKPTKINFANEVDHSKELKEDDEESSASDSTFGINSGLNSTTFNNDDDHFLGDIDFNESSQAGSVNLFEGGGSDDDNGCNEDLDLSHSTNSADLSDADEDGGPEDLVRQQYDANYTRFSGDEDDDEGRDAARTEDGSTISALVHRKKEGEGELNGNLEQGASGIDNNMEHSGDITTEKQIATLDSEQLTSAGAVETGGDEVQAETFLNGSIDGNAKEDFEDTQAHEPNNDNEVKNTEDVPPLQSIKKDIQSFDITGAHITTKGSNGSNHNSDEAVRARKELNVDTVIPPPIVFLSTLSKTKKRSTAIPPSISIPRRYSIDKDEGKVDDEEAQLSSPPIPTVNLQKEFDSEAIDSFAREDEEAPTPLPSNFTARTISYENISENPTVFTFSSSSEKSPASINSSDKAGGNGVHECDISPSNKVQVTIIPPGERLRGTSKSEDEQRQSSPKPYRFHPLFWILVLSALIGIISLLAFFVPREEVAKVEDASSTLPEEREIVYDVVSVDGNDYPSDRPSFASSEDIKTAFVFPTNQVDSNAPTHSSSYPTFMSPIVPSPMATSSPSLRQIESSLLTTQKASNMPSPTILSYTTFPATPSLDVNITNSSTFAVMSEEQKPISDAFVNSARSPNATTTNFPLTTTFPITTGNATNTRTAKNHTGFSFFVMGDVPYTIEEEFILVEQLQDIAKLTINENGPQSPLFIAHVGDFGDVKLNQCSEDYFRKIRAIFTDHMSLPVLTTPGDNDWNDCPNATLASELFLEYYTPLSSYLPDPPQPLNLYHPPDHPENSVFLHMGVLIFSCNLVGGQTSEAWYARIDDDIKFVLQHAKSYRGQYRNVIIFGHSFRNRFFLGIKKWFKHQMDISVVYFHGNGHVFEWMEGRYDDWPSFLSVQVDQGGNAPPLRVSIVGVEEDALNLIQSNSDDNVLVFREWLMVDRQGGLYV